MRISTFSPRRVRMFCVSAPKRGCGLITKSGTKRDSVNGPPGGAAGCVKSPTPSIGKHGSVGQTSPGRSAASSRARRLRMFDSTRRRSFAKPE